MAILFPESEPAAGSPGKNDLARASAAFPDGPNVAPGAHELEAAQGALPADAARGTAASASGETVRNPAKSTAAGNPAAT
ncbi:hypothetical protein C8245_20040 [Paracidovorax avenae]|uniref:hypothetical protein n=1 Tax=Paracidovorax avenae TaxID=80867 RepID=UPI000D221D20|nr:hypothetical protein [Paracidovorax avenae]AVS67658.1 hypothetical protein C8245_20040 [Paracidovorax avenae]